MRNWFSWVLPQSRKLALAHSGVGVATGALTASGALLLEDYFPKPGEPRVVSDTRCWLFVGVVGLTLLGLLIRKLVRDSAGTLLSLQVLDEGMGESRIGRNSRDLARRRTMSMRAVHRWADLPAHTHDGVIDVAELTAEVGRAAEVGLNTVQYDERVTIAPNMLWPIALSVGGRLPLAEFNTWLVEISTEDSRKSEMFRLDTKDLSPVPPLSVEPVVLEEPSGDRVAVALNYTQYEPQPDWERLLPLGIRETYWLRRPHGMGKRIDNNKDARCQFSGKELRILSRYVAEQLMRIREAAGDRELIVTARLPKTMSLAVGWYLAQFQCRFYTGTHLLHVTPAATRTMRVRDTPPAPGTSPNPP